jgi:hypothetical protein
MFLPMLLEILALLMVVLFLIWMYIGGLSHGLELHVLGIQHWWEWQFVDCCFPQLFPQMKCNHGIRVDEK